MSAIIEAVKRNLDITQNKPLKISLYEAFRKTIILGQIPAAPGSMRRNSLQPSTLVGRPSAMP